MDNVHVRKLPVPFPLFYRFFFLFLQCSIFKYCVNIGIIITIICNLATIIIMILLWLVLSSWQRGEKKTIESIIIWILEPLSTGRKICICVYVPVWAERLQKSNVFHTSIFQPCELKEVCLVSFCPDDSHPLPVMNLFLLLIWSAHGCLFSCATRGWTTFVSTYRRTDWLSEIKQ